MNSRNLTSWLLIIGPILTFLVWAILWPVLIGHGETNTDEVKEAIANPELARILSSLGAVVFISTLLGMVFLTRSMQGEDKSVAGYASVAGFFTIAVVMGATAATSSFGLLEIAIEQNDVATARMINATGNAILTGVPLVWSIGILLLGTTIVMQKTSTFP